MVRMKRSNTPSKRPSCISAYNSQRLFTSLQRNKTHHVWFFFKNIFLQRNLPLSLYLIARHVKLPADLRAQRQQLHMKHSIKQFGQSVLPFTSFSHSYQRNARVAHNGVQNLLLHCYARSSRQCVILDAQAGRRLDDLIVQTHRPSENFVVMHEEALERREVAENARLGKQTLEDLVEFRFGQLRIDVKQVGVENGWRSERRRERNPSRGSFLRPGLRAFSRAESFCFRGLEERESARKTCRFPCCSQKSSFDSNRGEAVADPESPAIESQSLRSDRDLRVCSPLFPTLSIRSEATSAANTSQREYPSGTSTSECPTHFTFFRFATREKTSSPCSINRI